MKKINVLGDSIGSVERLNNDASCLIAVNSARVSFNKESTSFTTREEKPEGSDEGLLSYLAKHNHWTPFSHVRHTFLIPNGYVDERIWFNMDEELLAGVVYNRSKRGWKIRASFHSWVGLLNAQLFNPASDRYLVNFLISLNPECSKAYGLCKQEVHTQNRLVWLDPQEETDPRFIDVTLRLKMPIFIARQWFKHQVGFTRNEVSRRYVDAEPEVFVPEEWRKRPEGSVKQGSSSELVDPFPEEFRDCEECWQEGSLSHYPKNLNHYLLLKKVCPEQARMVLPQATYTEFWETASLHSYKRLIEQRTDPHAQLEIQHYANAVKELLEKDYDQFLN